MRVRDNEAIKTARSEIKPSAAQPFQLVADYAPAGDQPEAISGLVDGIESGKSLQTLLGVTGSGKTFTIANVIESVQKTTMVLAHNKTLAAQLYAEFREFFPHNAVEYFVSYYDYYQPEAYVPARDLYIEKDSSVNEYIEQMRLSATKALLERKDSIIVATVSAIYGIGDPVDYHSMVLHLKCGDTAGQNDIIKRLVAMQYDRHSADFARGSFRVRGDTIDVYPAENNQQAIRIELFGNSIERLILFDGLTGQQHSKVERYTVYPSSHYVAPRSVILRARGRIQEELKTRLAEFDEMGKPLEANRLRERTQFDMEMMDAIGFCKGIENYSRHLSGRDAGEPPPTLFDYLPHDALLVIDESHMTLPQLAGMYRGDYSRKANLVEYGFRLPSAIDNRPLMFEEFHQLMPQTIFVSATPGQYEREHCPDVVRQVVRPTGLVDPMLDVRPVDTQVDDLLGEIREQEEKNQRTLVTTLTKRMAEHLADFLSDNQVRCRYLHSEIDTVDRVEILRDLRDGTFDVLVGINLLREGLDLPEVSLVAIFDADKEGFLRSEQALIQTIGRAARHAEGRVILYANKMTKSMKRAIDETNYRRELQIAYNEQHGITPKGISKSVKDIINTAERIESPKPKKTEIGIEKKNPRDVGQYLRALEAQMKQHADALAFEKAAEIRDRMKSIKKEVFGHE